MRGSRFYTHRQIAPRLASGEKRIPAGNGLPPPLKDAISAIAEKENKSRSWVIEQILLDWARGDPRLHRLLSKGAIDYIPRKTPEPERARA